MPTVRGIAFYLGNSPAAEHATAAASLMLDDDGYLCQQFHRALLNSQDSVLPPRIMVVIPELPAVEVKWIWAGQTAGVALWRRRKKIGAVSILLNGTEGDLEQVGISLTFHTYRLSAPQHVWDAVANEAKPVIITLFYDLRSFTDPVIATAAPALGNAFFSLFGTNG